MTSFPIPENESFRLQALYDYEVLDTPRESLYDGISQMVAEITGCPIGYVSFIDKDRQWMKSTFSLPPDFCEVPREVAFCNVSICKTSITQITDLRQHEILGNHQFVTGDPNFRFYCGAPLINPQGYALGTLCVLDFEVKELSLSTQEQMRKLAHQVVCLLELNKSIQRIEELQKSYEKEQQEYDHLLHSIMPNSIANELKNTGHVEPKYHDWASVMFIDFINFSNISKEHAPAELIDGLNTYFAYFNQQAHDLNIEPIKTIGDAYVCACGMPDPQADHAVLICLMALSCSEFCNQPNHWPIRIGIHTSAAYSGIVGSKKFTFDIWGECRELAEVLQEEAPKNGILISAQIYNQVQEYFIVTSVHDRSTGINQPIFQLMDVKPEYDFNKLKTLAKQGVLNTGGYN